MKDTFLLVALIVFGGLSLYADPERDILLNGRPTGCLPRYGHTRSAIRCALQKAELAWTVQQKRPTLDCIQCDWFSFYGNIPIFVVNDFELVIQHFRIRLLGPPGVVVHWNTK